ncbi:MAG: ABC transporter permease, partial [Acidobacteria bacterium]|nr:ABC transporter permease [Acidobacteriota bacterium]
MRFLLATLSLSYLTRHKVKSLLTLLGVVVGVATFSAIRSAQDTLTSGIRGTVDRMAGKAQLQISAEGGVPEELQEQLRELPGIRAQSPVIEQVVSGLEGVANAADIGSVLVLGVDLLGDREMRDYGFEGSEEDLDDPLLFLAQADSVALARPLAERAGVKVGESLVLRAPEGPKRVVVRGLLSPKGFAEAFGGNLVVMDVYAAQSLFGRGRRFDRIELRLEEGTTLDAATAVLEKALGPGFQVETPAMRGAQMEQLVTNFVAGFSISSGCALCIGTFLIFNSFTVSVNRRRRDIGTLRSLGATPGQIQTLFLAEAALVGLVGGALGVLAGGALADGFLLIMGGTANTVYGVADSSRHASLTLGVVLTSLAVGLLASLAGGFAPARAAARVPPTEAFAKGTYLASVPGSPKRRIAAGLALLAVAVAVALVLPVPAMSLVLLVLALAIAGAVLFAGPLSRLVLERCAGVLSRVAPVSGPLALDSLLGNPRRTAGTVTALTLSLAFVLGLGAYMDSTKKVMVRWMDDILTSDLYVRASANFVRPEFRYPASVREELLAIPGVRAVESYRGARIPYGGKSVLFMSIEIDAMMARTRHEFLQGTREEMLRGLSSEGKCAVSDNFHRLFDV